MTEEEKQELIARGDYIEDDNDLEDVDETYEEQEEDIESEEDEDVEDESSDDEEEDNDEESEENDEEQEDGYEEESEEDEEETPASKDHRIPKSRLDEVIAQRDDERKRSDVLQKQVEQLIDLVRNNETKKKEEKPAEPEFTYDFDKAEIDYTEAIIEGDSQKASQLRKEIRAAERKMATIEAQKATSSAVESARSEANRIRDEEKFDRVISDNIVKYPFLDQDSNEYNNTAVEKVNSLFDRFVKAGSSKAEALQEAVDLIAPSYVKPEAPKEEGIGRKSPKRSEKTARKRNAKANNAQPPKLKGKSTKEKSIDEYDTTKMTEAQFSKLPEDIKRKLRGD